MSLIDWQQQFTRSIARDESSTFEQMLVPTPGPDFLEGIGVYRNNYQGSRVNTLIDIYPVCRQVLGENCFDGLAHRYVQETGSSQADLNLYGEDFYQLLQTMVNEYEAFSIYPWLPDLARLEAACHQVYYLSDPIISDTSFVAEQLPSAIQVKSGRHVRWLITGWPVIDIWQAHQDTEEPEEIVCPMEVSYLLVDRPGFQARPANITVSEMAWLSAAEKGDTLENLLNNEALAIEDLANMIAGGLLELTVLPNV